MMLPLTLRRHLRHHNYNSKSVTWRAVSLYFSMEMPLGIPGRGEYQSNRKKLIKIILRKWYLNGIWMVFWSVEKLHSSCTSKKCIRIFHKKLYLQFLFYWQHMMLVNVKLYISGCNRIKFRGCRVHWSSSFLMVKLKWSWQHWHSCIVESLWKTLFLKLNFFFNFCILELCLNRSAMEIVIREPLFYMCFL